MLVVAAECVRLKARRMNICCSTRKYWCRCGPKGRRRNFQWKQQHLTMVNGVAEKNMQQIQIGRCRLKARLFTKASAVKVTCDRGQKLFLRTTNKLQSLKWNLEMRKKQKLLLLLLFLTAIKHFLALERRAEKVCNSRYKNHAEICGRSTQSTVADGGWGRCPQCWGNFYRLLKNIERF